MNAFPKAGDIFPAKEAIELIPAADLGPPIEVPEIPAEARPENVSGEEQEFWTSEILRLKKERGAIILAHNYQIPGIQDVADAVGDSLNLAETGKKSGAKVLVECSVLFMNQILAVMKKPEQIVLAPSLNALCSLAASVKLENLLAWKQAHPTGKVVSYVNTYIDIKAESDYCCASANADKVIKYVFTKYPDSPILFLPDVHLGLYAAKMLQKIGCDIDRLWLNMGACHVHDMIRLYHIHDARKEHPEAIVAIHPECGCTSGCIAAIARGTMPENTIRIRSTQGMIKMLKETPQKEIIVATEIGNIYPMSKAAPEKTFIPASYDAVCAFMKQNTLKNLYESLRDMKYEITVDPKLAARARIPIERMLSITD